MWQAINFIAFQSVPGLPVLVGGTLVVVGGAIVAFWDPLLSPPSSRCYPLLHNDTDHYSGLTAGAGHCSSLNWGDAAVTLYILFL